jgi:hypothetical protein
MVSEISVHEQLGLFFGPVAKQNIWWEHEVEQICSSHGGQEAEGGMGGVRTGSQYLPQRHTLQLHSYLPLGSTSKRFYRLSIVPWLETKPLTFELLEEFSPPFVFNFICKLYFPRHLKSRNPLISAWN